MLDTQTTTTPPAAAPPVNIRPTKETYEALQQAYDALNPARFRERSVEEVLATLAHEMTHLWQQHFGRPGRGRYHNREWADRMKAIGLVPTDTDEEGGKETGESVTQIIVADGPFARAVARLISRGFALTWTENPKEDAEAAEGKGKRKKSRNGVRQKFTCPVCALNAWAKPGAKLACGEHMEPMVAEEGAP